VHRRSLLQTSLGTAGLALFAGCNGLLDDDSGDGAVQSPRTETSPDRDVPTPSRPYRAPDAPTLGRPHGVRIRNTTPTERFVTLVVRYDDEDAFVDSRTVRPGRSITVSDVVATAGEFEVVVETATGSRGRFDWRVEDGFSDLWVGVGDDLDFRRLALCTPDCPGLSANGEGRPSLGLRTDVTTTEALDRAAAVVLDNATDATRTARLQLWDGPARLFAYEYRLPSRVRALVPISPSRPQYQVRVRTADGESRHDWFPGVRKLLYATLDSVPGFRCGLVPHDLLVQNETDTARTVTVRVSTRETALFERTLELGPGTGETISAAVDPAGVFEFAVETDDGQSKTVAWNHCAANGRLVVSVREQGILVAVQSELDAS
jgi:hypothetical protein